MGYRPIREYAIIGNDDRNALVNQDGSIDWCCFPHGAAPSVFAGLLDDEIGGHYAIRPTDSYEAERNYLDRTNVLESTFRTRSGRVAVTDFMPVTRDSRESDDRTISDQHAIYRRVQCTDGTVPIEMEWKPRFDYARANTTVERTERSFVAEGGDEVLHLQIHGDFEGRVVSDRVVGTSTVSEGETVWFGLQYEHFSRMPPTNCRSVLTETTRYWRGWVDELLDSATPLLEDDWREAVLRSSLVLKLLINEGTGAIYAAATTSLPEKHGTSRNWDYRYNWIRDAKFTVQALYNLGREEEAHKYFEWFRELSHEGVEQIQPIYGVHGEVELTEHELDHLSGYRYSTPVRIGNAASDQRQLDAYGSIVQAIYEMLRHDEQITDEDWDSIRSLVTHVSNVWTEPDSGIWEFRSEPRHYVHSKLLCWVALDRGIELAEQLDREAPTNDWREERDALEEEIVDRGYSESTGSFVQHFGTDEALDATCLLIPIYEFLPGDDYRVQSTIDTVLDELLTDTCLLYRTRYSDAAPEEPSAFVFCSFWLVDALVLAGRVEEARALFTDLLEYTSPLGLLSERIDPQTGELLGNFPQMFSHIGLLNSAIYLASVREEAGKLAHDPQEFDRELRPMFRKS